MAKNILSQNDVFSVGKGAMNALRLWEQRDDACTVYTVQAACGDQCKYVTFFLSQERDEFHACVGN